MPLGPSVPLPHVAQTEPINLYPPVALVGGVSWRLVLESLDNIQEFRNVIVNQAQYHPIGHLEVGATLSVDPKDAALPGGFEGETQFSHQTLLFMGLEIALHCKINLFYRPTAQSLTDIISGIPATVAQIGNRGGFYDPGFTAYLSAGGLVGYHTNMLGRNPITLEGIMPLFAIAHVTEGHFEYIVILNARLSSPARSFPLGASSVTLDIEAYSSGIGIVSSLLPKIGDAIIGGQAPNIHIQDALSGQEFLGDNNSFTGFLVMNKLGVSAVHPGFGELTAKIHSRAAAGSNQVLYAGRAPVTILAVWGGSDNLADASSLSPNYIRIVPA
ncbi:MAG: hypothetical protein QXU32_08770 [Nitrososphaerales archaeon]